MSNKQKYRARNKAFVDRFKQLFGCACCGYNKCKWALEFHHKDESQKDLEINVLCNDGYSIERIKDELRKCVLLCANCHREVHEEIAKGIDHDWDAFIEQKRQAYTIQQDLERHIDEQRIRHYKNIQHKQRP